MRRALILPPLLLLAACRQPGPAVPRPYAAVEEGLTLVYINPTLPQDQQEAKRLQVRVDKIEEKNGAQVITETLALGLNPPATQTVILKKGGVSVRMEGLPGQTGAFDWPVLPEGFPEQESWLGVSATCHVVGRAGWAKADKVLPSDRPHEGVWVETLFKKGGVGIRSRTLYLPGIGEVQTDQQQDDGTWVTVNLLTQFGFTDAPTVLTADPSMPRPSKPSARHAKH